MTSSGPYRQYIPDIHLSIEKDTENVPHDGRYYVLRGGKVEGKFRSLKQAQELFKQIVADLGYRPKQQPVQKKSAAELEVERYLEAKDFYWADSYRYRGGGGRGGRGGV